MSITRTFSLEDRQRAREALDAKIAAGAHFRRDWLDAPTWELLASQRGIRLPPWWQAPTPGKLKKWRQTLGEGPFREVYGDRMTPAKLIKVNPRVPLRAFVGQMLENWAERKATA